MKNLQLLKTNHGNALAGIGIAIILLAMTPLAPAHGGAQFVLAPGQSVCYGPPHLATTMTVTASWAPGAEPLLVGTCVANPVNGSCAGVPPAGTNLAGPFIGGGVMVTRTYNPAVCLWPAAENAGGMSVTVVLSSNP